MENYFIGLKRLKRDSVYLCEFFFGEMRKNAKNQINQSREFQKSLQEFRIKYIIKGKRSLGLKD